MKATLNIYGGIDKTLHKLNTKSSIYILHTTNFVNKIENIEKVTNINNG